MTPQTESGPDRIGLIHTVPGLVTVFDDLFAHEMPGWSRFHMVDESLLKNTISEGVLSKPTMRRVLTAIWSATDAGADAVVVTCSSLGAAVEAARPFCSVPLFRIDLGMAEEAVRLGTRIGVLATLQTTLAPTTALLETVSAKAGGAERTIVSRVVADAFARLSAGDAAGHDVAVAAALSAMAEEVEVIVLAQASMGRALTSLSNPPTIPVLTSPALGVAHIRAALA